VNCLQRSNVRGSNTVLIGVFPDRKYKAVPSFISALDNLIKALRPGGCRTSI